MVKYLPPNDESIRVSCSHSFSSKNFLIWRSIIATYFWSIFLWTMARGGFGELIHLTVWTSFMHLLYGTLALYSSFLRFWYISHENAVRVTDKMYVRCRKFCRFTEKVQIIATTIGITVVVAFWTLLWHFANLTDPLNPQIHGTVAIVVVIDFYLSYSRMPFKSTYLYIIIFSIIYIVWSIAYQFTTNNYIYPVMDWQGQPVGAVITALMVSAAALLIHLFLCWSNNKWMARNKEKSAQMVALAEAIRDPVELADSDHENPKETEPKHGVGIADRYGSHDPIDMNAKVEPVEVVFASDRQSNDA